MISVVYVISVSEKNIADTWATAPIFDVSGALKRATGVAAIETSRELAIGKSRIEEDIVRRLD